MCRGIATGSSEPVRPGLLTAAHPPSRCSRPPPCPRPQTSGAPSGRPAGSARRTRASCTTAAPCPARWAACRDAANWKGAGRGLRQRSCMKAPSAAPAACFTPFPPPPQQCTPRPKPAEKPKAVGGGTAGTAGTAAAVDPVATAAAAALRAKEQQVGAGMGGLLLLCCCRCACNCALAAGTIPAQPCCLHTPACAAARALLYACPHPHPHPPPCQAQVAQKPHEQQEAGGVQVRMPCRGLTCCNPGTAWLGASRHAPTVAPWHRPTGRSGCPPIPFHLAGAGAGRRRGGRGRDCSGQQAAA